MIKKTSSGAALVNTDTQWMPIDPLNLPPKGVVMQLINKTSGRAATSQYDPTHGWTHYQGVPVFQD